MRRQNAMTDYRCTRFEIALAGEPLSPARTNCGGLAKVVLRVLAVAFGFALHGARDAQAAVASYLAEVFWIAA